MYYDKELARNSLQQIENAILKIEERASSFHSADDFLKTPFGMAMLDAICMQFIAIGESLKGLDKMTNNKLLPTHPEIPWKRIKGLRDIVAHHYFEIDIDVIWWILSHELQPLKKQLLLCCQICPNSLYFFSDRNAPNRSPSRQADRMS